MSDGTVLDKAILLSQRLDRLAEHKDKTTDTDWLPMQITNLRAELNALSTQLALARSVNNLVGSTQVDLTNINAGFSNFRKRAGDNASYPSKESWLTAIRHIKATAATIIEQTLATWRTPTDRIDLLGGIPGTQAREQCTELKRIAAASKLEPGYVVRFQHLLGTLRTLLDSAPTLPPEVVSARRLFGMLDTVTLHDLTDEHIDGLRRSALDQRIVLRWKDV